jgi:hypothetical protein
MDWANSKSLEARIARLTSEIDLIDVALYGQNPRKNRIDVATSLEQKRDDIVRAAVLNIHTAIEDLLTQLLLYNLLEITTPALRHRLNGDKARALRRLLYGAGSLRFDMKLNLAMGRGLLTVQQQAALRELNTMWNRCSHNWQLNVRVRRGRRPAQTKPPLLMFRGSDLHKVPILDKFMLEFGRMYLRLYGKWVQ